MALTSTSSNPLYSVDLNQTYRQLRFLFAFLKSWDPKCLEIDEDPIHTKTLMKSFSSMSLGDAEDDCSPLSRRPSALADAANESKPRTGLIPHETRMSIIAHAFPTFPECLPGSPTPDECDEIRQIFGYPELKI